MRRSRWLVVMVAVFCTAWAFASAEGQDSKHLVRFGAGWYATIGDADDVSDNGLGAWASYEYRLSERIGLEAMAAYVDYDSFIDLLGGISLTPVVASLNVHLTPEGRADVYAGPTLGFARLEIGHDLFGLFPGSEKTTETEIAWGAALGVDVPLREGSWVFAGSVRYLTLSFEGGDFDNVVGHVGFGRRF